MTVPALVIFMVSGFAALVYQVIWQRLLTIFSGADVYSTSIVVAAFMSGLGVGSLLGGWLADRFAPARCLLLFVAAELLIAMFGVTSKPVLYDLLYHKLGHLAVSPALTGAALFATLLPPTIVMGVSLPLLARALTATVATAASTVGALYAANTVGAAIGAFVATWWLLPRLGLEQSLYVAALLNAACAIGALPLARALATKATAAIERAHTPVSSPSDATFRVRLSPWLMLFALSGFIALSFEIVWFRLLGVMLKSTSVTFGHLLAQYLFWLGLGSAIGSLLARHVKRPALVFLTTQAAAALYAGLSLSGLVEVVGEWTSLATLYNYFGSYEPINWRDSGPSREFLLLYGVLPVFLFAPATFLMGFAFPMVQRIVQTDLTMIGHRVGALLMANIAGSTAGALVTGWWLLEWLGTTGTLEVLIALSSLFGILAVRYLPIRRMWGYAAVSIITIASVVAIPAAHELWAQVHGVEVEGVLHAEDGSGVSMLKSAQGARELGVFVNGLGQSWLPYGRIHTALGALPAFLHPEPRAAMVIGLGSGDTLFAIAGRAELTRIVSVEIVKPQIATLRRLATRWPYPGLVGALEDPRIEHVFADGRLYLRRERRSYDLIEADALRPGSAYAGNLYSTAYFELVRRHLNPGGLAVTWSPTTRVTRTFSRVFPHVFTAGAILIGSNDPIRFNRAEIFARLNDPRVQAYYAAAHIDIAGLLRPLILSASPLEPSRHVGDVNTDLFPRDEFGTP